jgi:4-diphosphocytidyl-2-C-methyl-D-erythritol kinase
VLLFKPSFGISTPWAYGRMVAAAPAHYRPAAEAEARLATWLGGDAPVEDLLANNMEDVAFAKFMALPVLLAGLQRIALQMLIKPVFSPRFSIRFQRRCFHYWGHLL